MQPRQPIGVTCACCGKGGLLFRVRGSWQGRVKELGAALNSPAIQLPRNQDGRYTLEGFRCWRCRGE